MKFLLRTTALISGGLLLTCAHAVAEPLDALGVESLVARSASHAVYVEHAAMQRPTQGDDSAANEPSNPALAHAIGCLAVGTVGTSIAALAGTKNVVNILAGGHVVPASQLALYTAVVGVVFGTFCAVGQALTPLYLHLVRPSHPAERAPRQLEHKVQWTYDVAPVTQRFAPAGAASVTIDPNDMSVPVSWLHRPR